jgi:hypothetical protein
MISMIDRPWATSSIGQILIDTERLHPLYSRDGNQAVFHSFRRKNRNAPRASPP